MSINYKLLAIKLGDEMKNTTSIAEIERTAGALFDFSPESFEAKGVTSSRAQLIYNWILTLAGQTMEDEKKSSLLLDFISGLGADVSKYLNFFQSREVPQDSEELQNSNKVFLVHGRDEMLKEMVGRFLGQLGLEVVILSEQANQGRTVIEKLERSSKVAFCVVLLTPDDMGRLASDNASALCPRARQNVILELGYFTGYLGRERVCALVSGQLELPSDTHGIAYVPVDQHGGWKMEVIRELKSAGLTVNLSQIFGG
ncbi:MAG TPA: nucleotide-binding protein [Pantanalinema sp.]